RGWRRYAAASDRDADDAAVIKRVVGNSFEAELGKRVFAIWVLYAARVVAPPTEAEFVDQFRADDRVDADDGAVCDHGQPAPGRGRSSIHDSTEKTRHVAEAVRIGVAREGVMMRADLPIASHQVTVSVVLQVGGDDVVVRVERARPGDEVGLRDQVERAPGNWLDAVSRNLIVEERLSRKRVHDRAVTILRAAGAVRLILHAGEGGGGKREIADPLVRQRDVGQS